MFTLVADNEISIAGTAIKFPCSIMTEAFGKKCIVDIGELVIVNFYPKTTEETKHLSGIDMNRNIWAFDQKGNLVWKVAPPPERFTRAYRTNPYSSLFEENGKVYGGNTCGYDFEINLADGSVTPPKNPGRPW